MWLRLVFDGWLAMLLCFEVLVGALILCRFVI